MSTSMLSAEQIECWRQNIKNDTFANYYLSMAVAIHRAEGAEAALPWFESARSYPAREAEVAVALIDALNDLGRTAEAEEIAREMAQKKADFQEVGYIQLAQVYMNSAVIESDVTTAMYDRAVSATEKSKILLNRLLARAQRGQWLWRKERFDDALADWTIFRETAPAALSPSDVLIDILIDMERLLRTKGYHEWAVRIDVWLVETLRALGDDALADEVYDGPAAISRLCDRAARYLDDKSLERVLPTLLAFDWPEPQEWRLARLAIELGQAGRSEPAETIISALHARRPGGSAVAFLQFERIAEASRPEEAADWLRDVAAAPPQETPILVSLIRALLAAGLAEDAVRLGADLRARDKKQLDTLYLIGLGHMALGNQDAAADCFSTYAATAQKVAASRARAIGSLVKGKPDEALTELEEAVKAGPNPLLAQLLLGVVLLRLDRRSDALAVFGTVAQSYKPALIRWNANQHVPFRDLIRQGFRDAGRPDIYEDGTDTGATAP